MPRQILGGTGAWLVEKRHGQWAILAANSERGQASPLSESVVACGFQHAHQSPSICVNGEQYVLMDVIETPSDRSVHHLVAVLLKDRIVLREQAKGMLDGIRCAFAAAFSESDWNSKARRRSATPDQLICCTACRKIQTGAGTWRYWDELADRNSFLLPVSHLIWENCAIKLCGLNRIGDGLKLGDQDRMGCYHHGI